jgi:hypothetical protein
MSLKHGYNGPGGMILTWESEGIGENPVTVPLCPPYILQVLTRARTRASA